MSRPLFLGHHKLDCVLSSCKHSYFFDLSCAFQSYQYFPMLFCLVLYSPTNFGQNGKMHTLARGIDSCLPSQIVGMFFTWVFIYHVFIEGEVTDDIEVVYTDLYIMMWFRLARTIFGICLVLFKIVTQIKEFCSKNYSPA